MIEQPRGEHSAKPEAVLELIEAYFLSLPKIELNRRGPPRPGRELKWRRPSDRSGRNSAEVPERCPLKAKVTRSNRVGYASEIKDLAELPSSRSQ